MSQIGFITDPDPEPEEGFNLERVFDFLKYVAPAAVAGALLSPDVASAIQAHPYIAAPVAAALGYFGVMVQPPSQFQG